MSLEKQLKELEKKREEARLGGGQKRIDIEGDKRENKDWNSRYGQDRH